MSNKTLKSFLYIYVFVIFIFGCSCPKAAASPGEIIEIDIAKQVAADYLPKFFPGDWVLFTHFTCYSLEGKPAAYVFIFKKNSLIQTAKNLEIATLESLMKRRELKKNIKEIKEAKDISEEDKKKKIVFLKKELQQLRKALYQWENFVTAVTGARETDSLIIRCYPGLPSAFVEKQDLDDELEGNYPDKHFRLGRVLYFNAFDIRYEVIPKGKNENIGAELLKAETKPVSETAYTISLDNKSLKNIGVEAKQHMKYLAKKNEKKMGMSEEKRQQIEEGLKAQEMENNGKILSAFWYPLDVPSGAVASMYAEVEGFSIGTQFSFKVYKDDPLFDSEVFTTEGYVCAAECRCYVKATWTTEWMTDGLRGGPKFYFIVSKGFISRSSGKNCDKELKVRENMQPTAEKGEFEFSSELGEATNKDTPLANRIAVVLLHGSGSDKRQASLNYWYWWCKKFNEPAYMDKYKVYRYVYDSSKYIKGAGEKFAQFINNYSEFRNRHILIIAHSMGGLVARYALNICEDLRNKTKKLITLGTPHFGSPGANPTWVYTSMDKNGGPLKPMLVAMERFFFHGTEGDFDLAWHKPGEIPLDAFDAIDLFTALALYDDDLLLNSMEDPFTGCNILASGIADEKIVAFGGYFSGSIIKGLGMADTTPEDIKDEIYEDHRKLFLAQPLMFTMKKRDSSLIGDNDGLVPLESALLQNAHRNIERINISAESALNEQVDHAAFLDVPVIIDYIMSKINLMGY